MYPKLGLPRAAVCSLVVLIAAASRVFALDLSQLGYLRRDFTIEDGLPANEVHAVLESRNGFLWVATDGGLARFDGEHFSLVRLRSVSKEIPVLTLEQTPDGDLWAGTDAGLEHIPRAAVDHYDPSRVTLYHVGSGLSDQIMCIHMTRAGGLWVGTSGGLYRREGDGFVAAIPGESINRIEEAANGHLLIVTGHGFLEWDGRQFLPHPEAAAELGLTPDKIFHVYQDRHGVLWFCTRKGVARQIDGRFEELSPWGDKAGAVFRPFEDARGNMWFIGEKGLFLATGDTLQPVATDMVPRSIASDRDGDLWIGNGSEGLVRLKDRPIRMYTAADGLPNDAVITVLAAHDGTLWAGNNCGGVSRFDGQRFRTYTEKDGLSNSCIVALAEDAAHDLWVGTWGGGLNRFHDGHFTRYSTPEGLPSDVIRAIAPAPDGSLWIATLTGVTHMRNGQFRNYTTADGLSSDRMMTVYLDRRGGVWASTSTGVDRLEGDRFVPVPRAPDADEAPVSTFAEDPAGNLYAFSWVNGINRIEDNRLITVNDSLQFASMVASEEKDLWFSGRQGVFRVAAKDFLHAGEAPLDYTSFSRLDGLNTRECGWGQPNIAATPDGKIWVGTAKGLAMLDPARMPPTGRRPAIFLEEVDVGRDMVAPAPEFRLQPGAYHVAFHFTAIDLQSPENVRLQYRLDGVDPTWLDADSTRTAIYTDIPVGPHAFHIRASNGAGVWDREGVVYQIEQQPHVWETMSFRIGAFLSALLLLAGLYQLRLRQAAARLSARHEERMAERERIARELHDTLLQGFQGLILGFHATTSQMPPADPARRTMEEMLDRADQLMVEGRDRVRDLRTGPETPADLSRALARVGQEMGARGAEISVVMEGAPQDANPVVFDEIYWIGREALINACLHARAKRIEIEVAWDVAELRLRISDDGRGIDQQFLAEGKEGHYGMLGMRERARSIGAEIGIISRPGAGTEVELRVPASTAYRNTRQSSWGGLWRAAIGGRG